MSRTHAKKTKPARPQREHNNVYQRRVQVGMLISVGFLLLTLCWLYYSPDVLCAHQAHILFSTRQTSIFGPTPAQSQTEKKHKPPQPLEKSGGYGMSLQAWFANMLRLRAQPCRHKCCGLVFLLLAYSGMRRSLPKQEES